MALGSRASTISGTKRKQFPDLTVQFILSLCIPEAGDLALNDALRRLVDHRGLGVGVIEDEDLAR